MTRRSIVPAFLPPMLLSVLVPAGAFAQPGTVDPCALFTREEVAALSKDEVRKPRESGHQLGSVSSSSCWYRTRYDTWHVKILVERGRSSADLKDMLAALKKVAKETTGQGMKSIPGFGDEAYWSQIGPTNGMLSVVIGTDFVTIQTWGKAPGAGTLEGTKPIATTAIKRFLESKGADL